MMDYIILKQSDNVMQFLWRVKFTLHLYMCCSSYNYRRGCHDYKCTHCKSELEAVHLSFCLACTLHKPSNQLYVYGNEFESFCLECCLNAYNKNIQGKKVILKQHIYQPDKYEIFQFLKGFCYFCYSDIRNEREQDRGVREIYPLNNNTCTLCTGRNIVSNQPHCYMNSNTQGMTVKNSPKLQNIRASSLKNHKPVQSNEQFVRNHEILCRKCGFQIENPTKYGDYCQYCLNQAKRDTGKPNRISFNNNGSSIHANIDSEVYKYSKNKEIDTPKDVNRTHKINTPKKDDSVLVECYSCGMRMQANTQGWQNMSGNLQCNSCLSKINRTKYNSNKPSPNNFSNKKLEVQPQIIEYNSPESRPAYDDSWDETIILEPIQPKQNHKSKQSKQKTAEQFYKRQQYVTNSTDPIIIQDEVIKNGYDSVYSFKQSYVSETTQISRSKGQLNSQPEIIEQDNHACRHKINANWDLSVILQPISNMKSSGFDNMSSINRNNKNQKHKLQKQSFQNSHHNITQNIKQHKITQNIKQKQNQQQRDAVKERQKIEQQRQQKQKQINKQKQELQLQIQIEKQKIRQQELRKRQKQRQRQRQKIRKQQERQLWLQRSKQLQAERQRQQIKYLQRYEQLQRDREKMKQQQRLKEIQQFRQKQIQSKLGYSRRQGYQQTMAGSHRAHDKPIHNNTYIPYDSGNPGWIYGLKDNTSIRGNQDIKPNIKQPSYRYNDPDNSLGRPIHSSQSKTYKYATSSYPDTTYQSYYNPSSPPSTKYQTNTHKIINDLTGFRSTDKKQNRTCSLCLVQFTTLNRQYFVKGGNACINCYLEFSKLTN